MSLPVKSALKRAVDLVLCSICYIRPEFFGYMLDWLGVTVSTSSAIPRPTSASISDDSKQQRSPLTDDIKEASHMLPQGTLNLNLNEAQLITLATVCQSPTAIRQLLDSGFPAALARIILEFCSAGKDRGNIPSEPTQTETNEENSKFDNGTQPSTSFSFAKNGKTKSKQPRPTTWSAASEKQGWFSSGTRGHQEGLTDAAKAGYPIWNNQNQESFSVSEYTHLMNGEFIAAALNFFTEVCNEGLTRDWLGGPEGSVFWLPLLNVLCDPVRRRVGSTAHTEKPSDSGKCSWLSNAQRSAIEVAVLRLLTRCCWTHPTNQQLLAQVLCEVIRHQGSQHHVGSLGFLHAISGFTRRLILQLLLENEKIQVFVRSQHSLPKCSVGVSTNLPQHPRFGCGHCFRFLYVSTQTTCQEIIKNVSDSGITHIPAIPEVKEEKEVCKKDIAEIGLELVDHLSVAAGVTAKDKRQRDAKSGNSERASVGRGLGASGPSNAACSSLALPTYVLTHDLLPEPLPGPLTLAQLMTLLDDRGLTLSNASLTLTLTQTRKSKMEAVDLNSSVPGCLALLESNPLPTTLQVFASMGGLALLAQHLPLLYPEITRQTTPVPRPVSADRNATDLGTFLDNDWVKVEAADEINDDFLEFIPPGASSPQSARANQLPPPSIPPHSLAAFGLFLRLPGYAEVLLRERKKAQCLLRLALGITDNGEGGDIFQTSVAASLPTLPFQVLQQLFDATPLTTDDGMLLRRMTLDVGAIHLLFACLAVLSHQSGDINLPGFQQELVLAATRAVKTPQEMLGKSDDKSHLYWAKGTGFGTGSTNQSWDVEQAILRQRSEEEHVTCLLQVLASYINPGGQVPSVLGEKDDDKSADEDNTQLSLLPPVFPELLSQSCLLPAICSYLRNDSVLDMARHIPLYRALLQLLRALAVSSQLVGMLLPSDNCNSENALSICCLLTKMKSCVDIYASRLKTNKGKGNGKSSGKTTTATPKTKEEEEENEGLAQLIPDIQETARIVQMATERLTLDQDDVTHDDKHEKYSENSSLPKMVTKTLEERYMEVMKRLQFESFEMIVEDEDTFRFTVTHHFEPNMRAAGDHSHPARARRLAQEAVTLSTSLPLSFSSSVFVRCDQDRLDIMKVLITGPAETPYANGCFEFDVYFPPDYPNSPMMINLETTGHHTVRFNPNLYNDGKVCLSVLNTWHGRPEEKWNPQTSSFLQVLVSIQSLILVQEPYFNEPGYERSRGTPSGTQSSREYDSNIRLATVKWAMLEQLRNPCICFKEAVQKHFWMKRCEIVRQIEGWIAEMDAQGSDRRAGRTIALNCVALKHHLAQLKEEFAKMKSPDGLEDLSDLLLDNGSAPPMSSNAASGSSEPQSSSVESSIQDSPDSNDASVGPV